MFYLQELEDVVEEPDVALDVVVEAVEGDKII